MRRYNSASPPKFQPKTLPADDPERIARQQAVVDELIHGCKDAAKTARLLREVRNSVWRLHCLLDYVERQVDELDIPAATQTLKSIGLALLRIEQEAQRQLPWLRRDGGRA